MFKCKPLAAAIIAILATQAYADENSAEQNQSGADNIAEVTQTGGQDNLSYQSQIGANNDGTVTQAQATMSDAVQTQTGNLSLADIVQNSTEQSEAVQLQNGDNHDASIVQTDTFGASARQYQEGSFNTAITEQVLAPEGPLLSSLGTAEGISELDVVAYAAGYQRFWKKPQGWLEDVLARYSGEKDGAPPPQLAIGSWYAAAMCTHLLVKIATGKVYKCFPEFYMSSLFEEEAPPHTVLK